MYRLIADIVVCTGFYFVYHKYYIKHCKEEWINEVTEKVVDDMKKKEEKKHKGKKKWR